MKFYSDVKKNEIILLLGNQIVGNHYYFLFKGHTANILCLFRFTVFVIISKLPL